ncbi:hypothetical protein AVEN_10790-1 [Araneus ventricosus]|uniref:Uncharacterized protein n=1 Tax=Araneus ventricosus TaxID=182803 RepID=A0A4Y2DDC2_ARAVE|nr:hypothetical protein AVEN_10790-1 [Araneus ventricosus]
MLAKRRDKICYLSKYRFLEVTPRTCLTCRTILTHSLRIQSLDGDPAAPTMHARSWDSYFGFEEGVTVPSLTSTVPSLTSDWLQLPCSPVIRFDDYFYAMISEELDKEFPTNCAIDGIVLRRIAYSSFTSFAH